MKTTVGVFFGGRSTEHEISVISALQAINAFNKEKYEIIPIYITKQGRWFSGDALLEVKNYRDMAALQNMCAEVYMIPEYGDYNLYRKKRALFGNNIWAKLDVVIPVLHGSNAKTVYSRAYSNPSVYPMPVATHSPRPTAWTR